jgi:hypothetical protein
MRTSIVFLMGLLLGTAISTGSAQGVGGQGERLPGMNGVNHIAMSVENFDEAFASTRRRRAFAKCLRYATIKAGLRRRLSRRAAILFWNWRHPTPIAPRA